MPGAVAVVALLFVAAAAFVIVGIYLLAGLPWAFIAFGLMMFGAAVHLRAGLTTNG